MQQLLVLFTCLLSGFILRKTNVLDKSSAIALNQLIIYFFIPVITLLHVPRINFEFDLIWLSVTPFLVYLFSYLFFRIIGKIKKIDRATEGALIMTTGIGSTSFVGFPIFELLYGEEGLSLGIILSLAGTFLVFNTAGIMTGLFYSKKDADQKSILKKIFTFPPLVAFLIALSINLLNINYPLPLETLLQKMSAPFSVIALLAIGLQIDISFDRKLWSNVILGQFYKLILSPILIAFTMWHFVGLEDLVSKICILGAAIGSMNAISILAAQFDLNPRLSMLMPAISIPISIPVLLAIDVLLK